MSENTTKDEEEKVVKHYAVEPKVAVAIINYLASRPYSEVATLIAALQDSEPVFE